MKSLYYSFLLAGLLIAGIAARGTESTATNSPVSPLSGNSGTNPASQIPPKPIFHPQDFGAKGDGTTVDTTAIQKAIDACAGKGGSVVLTPGTYLSKPIVLKGGMTFHLEKGAVLLGTAAIEDYPVLLPDSQPNRLCRSLIYACNADNLTISGAGSIEGQPKLLNLPPQDKKNGSEAKRPSLIRIFRSKNVSVRDITLRNPCMWTEIYSECDHLLIDHVTVDAPAGIENLDGLDVCDCSGVIVRNCLIFSEDDGICLKSHLERGLQDVTVENNRISSFHANGIKLGTATTGPISHLIFRNNTVDYAKLGGICIESVDGSAVSDVNIQGLFLNQVCQPIYVRLGHRTKSRPVGSINGVVFQDVKAIGTHDQSKASISITGIPGANVQNVTLKDCFFQMPGGVMSIPGMPVEHEKDYPQSNIFGNTPAYGIFIRHAVGIVLDHVVFGFLKPDARPWICEMDADVRKLNCRDLKLIPLSDDGRVEMSTAR